MVGDEKRTRANECIIYIHDVFIMFLYIVFRVCRSTSCKEEVLLLNIRL